MVHIRTQHYNNGAFTMKDARKYISEHSQYGIRGYLFEKLKNNSSVIWFTETDYEAECKYPDTRNCND